MGGWRGAAAAAPSPRCLVDSAFLPSPCPPAVRCRVLCESCCSAATLRRGARQRVAACCAPQSMAEGGGSSLAQGASAADLIAMHSALAQLNQARGDYHQAWPHSAAMPPPLFQDQPSAPPTSALHPANAADSLSLKFSYSVELDDAAAMEAAPPAPYFYLER